MICIGKKREKDEVREKKNEEWSYVFSFIFFLRFYTKSRMDIYELCLQIIT